MPTRFNTNYLRLTDDKEFEELLCDICALEWCDRDTEINGRSGQPQWGVDVFGQPAWENGAYYGVQCKLRPSGRKLNKVEIEDEVVKARDFFHPLKKLIIATDLPRDNGIQAIVGQISEREVNSVGFSVEIWFWPDITKKMAAYPRIIAKYYHDQLAGLINTELLERLIDRPLQILSIKSSPTGSITPLEERLQFRGLQIVDQVISPVKAKAVDYHDLLPDGIVYQIDTFDSSETGSALTKFIANILAQEKLVGPDCPIFIFAPSITQVQLQAQIHGLLEQPERIIWLTSNSPLDDAADELFTAVFDHGYKRRGDIPTIDVSVRTRPNKPASALLDLDWCSHLGIEHQPTEATWNELFIPALRMVTTRLTGLKDVTRLQVESHLPVPASVAVGFHLNLRVSNLGVWARPMGNGDNKYLWLFDGEPAAAEIVETWLKKESGQPGAAIVELSIGHSIHATVSVFAERAQLRPNAWIQLHLPTDSAGINEAEAVAYADHVGSLMRRLTGQGITDSHLFLRMPSALGVLIGQKLHACGRIHLYWFNNKEDYFYKPAFTLA